ncbi:MAG: flagellar hook-basal body complex protein FliE [Rhodospirillales bacterium]|jgi:flagellar hook-basal body complex protein FliE|nr:flagellar hook-basal body complex protein FliE [Rhodospirillales bacterium]
MPTPISSYASALSAYAQAARAPDQLTAAPSPAAATGASGSFADTMNALLQDAVETGAGSEQKAMSAIADRKDLAGVVTAVAEAEVALQSVIAIRDRAVEAYKDIMRMPI